MTEDAPSNPSAKYGRRMSHVSRRPAIFAAGLVVIAGSVAGPVPSASAAASSAIQNATFTAQTLATSLSPAGTCTVTDPMGAVSSQVLTDGRRTFKASDTGTIAHTSDTADTVAVGGSYLTTVTSSMRGDVRRIDVSGALTGAVAPALGRATACDTAVSTSVDVDFELVITRPGWITVGGVVSRYGSVSLDVSGDQTDTDFEIDLGRTSGRTSSQVYVVPDIYLVDLDLDIDKDVPLDGAPAEPDAFAGTMVAYLEFAASGAATTATTGSGARAVTLPASLGCRSRSATLNWRAPARRATVAKIRVNGRIVRTVRTPSPGTSVVVRGLPRAGQVTVSVTIGGATARRTYAACEAAGY